jgi:hypothetical protein
MFYVKTHLADGMSATTEITEGNVFCRCPDCGSEVAVDLAEVLGDGVSDLLATSVCGPSCTARRLKEVSHV